MAPQPDVATGAQIAIAFAADGNGRTYIDRQHAAYPFHICRPHYLDEERPGLATLYIQSCSGGLYEDDALDLSFSTEAGAEAYVTTQSPTVVHSMPKGSARQHVRMSAGEGSHLEYMPDPQILFPDSRLHSSVHVRLEADAAAVVADAFLLHDPARNGGVFASYASEITITGAEGRILAIDRLGIEGTLFAAGYPGVNGRYQAQATLIVAQPGGLPKAAGETFERLPRISESAKIGISLLPNSAGFLLRVLAADGASLSRTMQACWAAARFALNGSYPTKRRK